MRSTQLVNALTWHLKCWHVKVTGLSDCSVVCVLVFVLQRELGTKHPTADPAHVAAPASGSTTAEPAAAALSGSSAAELLAPMVTGSSSVAAQSDLPATSQDAPEGTAGAAAEVVEPPQKPVLIDWPLLLRIMKIWQIWVLACSESIKSEQRHTKNTDSNIVSLYACMCCR